MSNWRRSRLFYALVFFIIPGAAVCSVSSYACAGGVQFGFGVDVSAPVVVDRTPPPSPMMVERVPMPPPVVVERTAPPPPVMVERVPPAVVYGDPVLVERRSTVYYYYRPSYQYHSYQVETERNYYRHRTPNWEDDGEY